MKGVFVALPAAAALAGAVEAATVEVTVEGVEGRAGTVAVALCVGGLAPGNCRIGTSAPADGRIRDFVFEDVAPGVYAAAAYQDLNGNGRLDRTGLGLPLEPYGFSGGVGRRARPDFASASFLLREPGTALRVRLQRALPSR